MKRKPTHADPAGSRYLALQRLARAQKRGTAELLQLYVLESFLRRLRRSRHDDAGVCNGQSRQRMSGWRRVESLLRDQEDGGTWACQRGRFSKRCGRIRGSAPGSRRVCGG